MMLGNKIKISGRDHNELAPGDFVRLTAGNTHYLLAGPEHGNLIVLVHGIAGPMSVFDPLVDYLTKNGFRTLQYDLYGRGFSDRPDVRYDLDLFTQQLLELLRAVNINGPFSILGWSLGGMIAASYASQFQKSIKDIVYIAPAGIHVSLPLAGRFAMLPLLGEILIALAGRRVVLGSLADGVIDLEKRKAFMELAADQMNYPGYFRSFLSTLRHCAYMDVSDRYKTSGKNIPALMIMGSEDPSIPSSVQKELIQLIPQLELREIIGVGHCPHFEKPIEVGSMLAEFVGKGVTP